MHFTGLFLQVVFRFSHVEEMRGLEKEVDWECTMDPAQEDGGGRTDMSVRS